MPAILDLRFRSELLNRRIAAADIGEAFQDFVFELLHVGRPELYRYPAGGKDGGIDLAEPVEDGLAVIECKYIGEDGLEEAQARWRRVAASLERNLTDPAGPPSGQGQYAPWFQSSPAVCSYTFCVSSILANESQRQKLRAEIASFFAELARSRPHLAHLSGVVVDVLPWQDLSAQLKGLPHLLFRWFPEARPRGLSLLGEGREVGGFRAYLGSERLPYYARQEHLARFSAPTGAHIADEEELLRQLALPELAGLVITGGGGLGKTRLMLELGRLSQDRGWSVFRTVGRVGPESLEQLADSLSPGTPALLLIDYVETQPDYADLVESLTLLADERRLTLRFVACCRTSFYPSVRLIGRHAQVDLSPHDAGTAAWLEGYRTQAIRHILKHTAVPDPLAVAATCRGIPVLAVFAAWLHRLGRAADLHELVHERDFGTWVLKRVQQSFHHPVAAGLASLVALLPLEDRLVDLLGSERRELLNTLVQDAWVDRDGADGTAGPRWEAAHDVLVDQVLVSYLESISAVARPFVRDLLAEGERLGAAASVLTSLQRLAFSAVVQALPWIDLLSEALVRNPVAWCEARFLVLRSPLLAPGERLELLSRTAQLWDGAEHEVDLQNAIGWIAAREAKHPEIGATEREALLGWLRRLAPFASRSNYLLTKGLLLAPESVQESALSWLLGHPQLFQTHYLLRAWLEAKRAPESVARTVELWLARFRRAFHASFVFAAWLDAGGAKELVAGSMSEWLAEHRRELAAQFVYKSWLDAGGAKELIAGPIVDWLAEHRGEPVAQFVYQSWLDAGGARELAAEPIAEWLAEHRRTIEASYVYKSWLDAGGAKELIAGPIGDWLAEHRRELAAQFVYTSWLDTGGAKELVAGSMSEWLAEHRRELAAQFVYKSWLDAGGAKELVAGPIVHWLAEHRGEPVAQFVYQSWLDAGGAQELVAGSIGEWLAEHRRTVGANYVCTSWLDAGGDKEFVRSALSDWLKEHADDDSSGFVLRAWLEAGGDFEIVREPAILWLSSHRQLLEAGFLLKYLARQPGLTAQTVQDVLFWCRSYPQDNDALWRLASLERYLLLPELEGDVVATAEAVIRASLREAQLDAARCGLVSLLFATLSVSAGLRASLRSLFLNWLRHSSAHRDFHDGSVGPFLSVRLKSERPQLMFYLADLIRAGELEVERDHEALQRFFRWVGSWDAAKAMRARDVLVRLALGSAESSEITGHPDPSTAGDQSTSSPLPNY